MLRKAEKQRVACPSLNLTITEDEMRAGFASLAQPSDLADLLEIPHKTLCFYAYKKKNYCNFEIPKKSGGTRLIFAPDTPMKIIQRKLSRILYAVYGSRGPVHGFARGRSIRTNALRHVGAEWLLNFDLKDFFPSIHFGRVAGLFAAKPYKLPKDVANLLAQICCHNASLPAGAPTSPIVANMVCTRLDSELKTVAWTAGCIYTRYADDITFSTRAASFPTLIVTRDSKLKNWVLSQQIVDVSEGNTFKVNPYKTRVRSKNSSQEVTGIRINSGLNVSSHLYQQVRALLHSWEKWAKEGEDQGQNRAQIAAKAQTAFLAKLPKTGKENDEPELRDVLRGKIEFIGFIKGRDHPIYVRLLQRLQRLDLTAHAKPIIVGSSTHESVLRQAIWLLYDYKQVIQGTAFAIEGGCLLTAAHNLENLMWASRPSFSGEKFLVETLYVDHARDIASVKIDCCLPVQLRFGGDLPIALTSPVCVVGFPHYHLNDSVAFRFGKVVQERSYFNIPHFVVDADIVKGNSGGPVLDSQNRVIGIAVKGLEVPGTLGDNDQLSSFIPVSKSLFPHI